MMRIIAGARRGKKLQTLEGLDTRPTLERVKQAVFGALQFELEGRKVLDLFAGSGQLGLEAISRGAAYCWFNDQSNAAFQVVQKNIAACSFEKQSKGSCVSHSMCVKMIEKAGYLPDLVFLDPPYGQGLAEDAIRQLAPILPLGAIVVVETAAEEALSYEGLVLRKEYRYGAVKITMLEKREQEE